MVCQNCGKHEATTHIKQVVNADTTQQHLCAECAQHLGYTDVFSGFGLSLSDMFGGFFGDTAQQKEAASKQRCQKCGYAFADIVREGKVGCADCYRTFYDKLKPSLQRIHGKIKHSGKTTAAAAREPSKEDILKQKKEELAKAVNEQNFEHAAQLRDEIRALEGGNQNA